MTGQSGNNGVGSTLPGFVLDLPLVGMEWVESRGESVGVGMIGNRVVVVSDAGIRWTHDHAMEGLSHNVAECHSTILADAREEAAVLASLSDRAAEMVAQGMPLPIARMLDGGSI